MSNIEINIWNSKLLKVLYLFFSLEWTTFPVNWQKEGLSPNLGEFILQDINNCDKMFQWDIKVTVAWDGFFDHSMLSWKF